MCRPYILQSSRLYRSGICQLCTKYLVPEATCHAESVLEISEVMLKVVFLQLSVVRRKISMVEKVVREVVTDVAKDPTREDLNCSKSIVSEDDVGKFVERYCKYDE